MHARVGIERCARKCVSWSNDLDGFLTVLTLWAWWGRGKSFDVLSGDTLRGNFDFVTDLLGLIESTEGRWGTFRELDVGEVSESISRDRLDTVLSVTSDEAVLWRKNGTNG